VRVSVVGAGQVGATAAMRIAEARLADVALVDVVEGLARGKALDLSQAAPIAGHACRIEGSESYEICAGSDLVVVTAGVARRPGMSRDDLLKINAGIVREVIENIKRVAPDAILLMVSNPLDVTTHLAHQLSGLPKTKVFGMAGVLDTARFRCFIAAELDTSPDDVQAMVLGGHGDTMVPLPRHATVSGIPITQLLDQATIDRLVERTRNGGAEIVSYLKTGSAYYAPAAAIAQMAASILRDERRILPTCVLLEGEYGLSDVFLGVPVVLGRNGVEQVVELKLDEAELAALHRSAEHVRETIAALEHVS